MVKFPQKLIPIIFIAIIPTLLIWLPFFLRADSVWGVPIPKNGMATIVANYDGPLYLVVAKTLYNKDAISQTFQFPLPTEYYAAHFPAFPLLIKLAGLLIVFPYAMLLVTLASSILCLYFFDKFARQYVSDKNALFLTFVFSIFPARFLIVRSVGSPEPFFIGAIIASIYYFQNKKYLLAGVWGAIAQFTKSPAILLFGAYILAIVIPALKDAAITKWEKLAKNINFKAFPVILIPITLLLVFGLFKLTYNNFFAYFNSGDNIHLQLLPFQIFNYSQAWVGTFWLEEVIFIYLFGILGFLELVKQKQRTVAYFVGIFFASILFVSHRDLLRYSLPITPFILIAFRDYLVKKEFKIAIVLLALPIYLYSLSYISQNVMPISNWAPFL